jgi:adenylate cyclase
VLVDALATLQATGDRLGGAELYRLKGDLLLQSNGQGSGSRVQEEAEEYLFQAIDTARLRKAKSLELRAVMSLVRLRQQQAMQSASRNTHHETRGKLAEAHQMLSELYGWFTEGFDTKDLQEAKALIEALSH